MQVSPMMKIANAANMFQTIEQRTAFLAKQNLHMNDDGDIRDENGCMYNPWCYAYWADSDEHKGHWISVVGVCTDHDSAIRRLYQLKRNNPSTKFKMYRANDLEDLTVYTK